MSFDLKSISPSISGPKRPFDRISLFEVKNDWQNSLIRKPNDGGYSLPT
jgi:aconitase A